MDNTPQMPPAYQGPQQYPSQSPSFQEYSSPSSYTPPAYQPPTPAQPYQPYPQYQQMPPNQGVPVQPNAQAARPRRRTRYSWMRNASGTALMLRGGLMAVIGIVITVISYSVAQSQADSGGSGTYVVFTGLILFGVIYFFIGLVRWLKTRR